MPTPAIAPANLGNVALFGKTSNTTDAVILFNTTGQSSGQAYANVSSTVFKELSQKQKWTSAEFNIFGVDGSHPTATFNDGATMTVRTAINNGTSTAPFCSTPKGGETFEGSNLYFNGTCCPYSGASPAIAFTQGTGTNMTATCPAISGNTVASPSYTVSAIVNPAGPSDVAMFNPSRLQLPRGGTAVFKMTQKSGYGVGQAGSVVYTNGTSCPLTTLDGAGDVWYFALGPVTVDCGLQFNFKGGPAIYTVAARANPSGAATFSPSSVKAALGDTIKFTMTQTPGYGLGSNGIVFASSTTCPVVGTGGSGNVWTFTQGPITGDCITQFNLVGGPTSYTVSSSAGAGGSISPAGSISAPSGQTKSYAITPNSGYTIASVGGTCGGTLSGNTYTTKAITASCTVTAAFTPVTTSYTVTSSAGTGGSISPSGSVAVTSGASRAYTVTPNSGYTIGSVGGTCGGTLSGNTYTTRAIATSCTVTAAFTPVTTSYYTVTSSVSGGGGSISPAGSVSVIGGTTRAYTLTPGGDWAINTVGGTCGGTLSGTTYTTKPITASCSVTATFRWTPKPNYTITSSAGTGGSINPAGNLSVASGTTSLYVLTPNPGYTIGSVGGTCGGAISGNIYYVTKAITANCTVTATFK